jgi:hypothetical protein
MDVCAIRLCIETACDSSCGSTEFDAIPGCVLANSDKTEDLQPMRGPFGGTKLPVELSSFIVTPTME